MLFTIEKSRKAKWILLFMFTYSILEYIKNFQTSSFNHWFAWVFLLIAIYNLFFIVYLLVSKNIKAFLEDKPKHQTMR
jgi:hypothetical protein